MLVTAICLAQSASELQTPEIRRVGDKLACLCGACKNTVATCQMLHCHYAYPARQKIARMLGGATITSRTRAHAREMLGMAAQAQLSS